MKEKTYINKFNTLLKDTFKSSSHLWDLIDFDNFWMFNNKLIKCGGMIQWVEANLGKDETSFRGGNPFDFHPSDVSHKSFCDKILIPLITGDKNEKNN